MLTSLCALLAVLLGGAAQAGPGGPDSVSVLVVVNASSADSVRIGEYYARKRAIPGDQILRLTGLPADPPDGIDRTPFERTIQTPIAQWLARHQAQDRILFIVLTKGIPLRINAGNAEGSAASVDSELAVLYFRMTGETVSTKGPLPNPYFAGDAAIADLKPFSRETQSTYLVTRLDGYTVRDVLGLIDRGMAPSKTGRFVLDGKLAFSDKGNEWLRAAADRLKAAGVPGDRIVFDDTYVVVTDQTDVLGYYSWGSNDPAVHQRHFGLRFQPGAIGGMFVSTDGRTFREPPKNWTLSNWRDKRTWFAGSPQSLAGDLIRDGITGVAGHVAEPLLGHTIRPDILFPAYVAGFTLAESYYLAMPSVSWMTVVVGDPLCAPFASPDTTKRADPPAIDPETELPMLFSRRRLAILGRSDVPLEAHQRLLRAQSRFDRGDEAGARADLERATAVAPGLVAAQMLLATKYEEARDYDNAIARYRIVLEKAPDTIMALNNLAYMLATEKKTPQIALPLAERARALAPRTGVVVDTLGWICHLLGDNARALQLLVQAAGLNPDNAEIRLHLALVQAASGNAEAARQQATKAVQLEPSYGDRQDLKALLGPRPKR